MTARDWCRDDARRVLAAISLELGPAYLPQIATALSSALPSKGYTAQILGYTFNTLLTAACQVTEGPFWETIVAHACFEACSLRSSSVILLSTVLVLKLISSCHLCCIADDAHAC